MLERLKKALVESFVGTIALGWLLAQGVVHFTYILTGPLSVWITRHEFRDMSGRPDASPVFLVQEALLELARSFSLLLLGYVLPRWLYFNPPAKETFESGPDQTEGTRTADGV